MITSERKIQFMELYQENLLLIRNIQNLLPFTGEYREKYEEFVPKFVALGEEFKKESDTACAQTDKLLERYIKFNKEYEAHLKD